MNIITFLEGLHFIENVTLPVIFQVNILNINRLFKYLIE